MGVGGQIDRYVVPECREVGAVIEVPAAQVVLIGFAGVGMHDRHQSRRRFENLARPGDRTLVEVRAGDGHFTPHRRRHRRAAGHIRSASVVGGRRRGRCGRLARRRRGVALRQRRGGNRNGRQRGGIRRCWRRGWFGCAARSRGRVRRRLIGSGRRRRARRWRLAR